MGTCKFHFTDEQTEATSLEGQVKDNPDLYSFFFVVFL